MRATTKTKFCFCDTLFHSKQSPFFRPKETRQHFKETLLQGTALQATASEFTATRTSSLQTGLQAAPQKQNKQIKKGTLIEDSKSEALHNY